MSFSDKPREPRAVRRPRARVSLKMQAIGFLSRREHSRQELRAKLLDSLRKRAREEAALAASAEKAALALAEALREQPSNGIDDAFAPPMPTAASMSAGATRGAAGARGTRASAARVRRSDPSPVVQHPALDRPALDTLSLANGAPLPASLRASLDAAAAATGGAPAPNPAPAPDRATAPAPAPLESRSPLADSFDAFVDLGGDTLALAPDDLADPPGDPLDATALELTDPEAAVDELLDWLVANKYLSETRFVESRVNARSRKQGTLLIKLELSRHGLALEPEQTATLRETEFARAQALWQRRFGEVATEARLRAKQARFLAARGFAADVVRRVVGGRDDE